MCIDEINYSAAGGGKQPAAGRASRAGRDVGPAPGGRPRDAPGPRQEPGGRAATAARSPGRWSTRSRLQRDGVRHPWSATRWTARSRSTREGGTSTPPPTADASAHADARVTPARSPRRLRRLVVGRRLGRPRHLRLDGREPRALVLPPAAKTSLERLRHYATRMPCVEVDTSTYAIPSADSTARWASVVPDGFVFHVKLFGLFCGVGVPLNALPRTVREMPCMAAIVARGGARVGVDACRAPRSTRCGPLPRGAAAAARRRQARAIVVQYQNSFWPSSANRRIVEGVRQRLDGALQITLGSGAAAGCGGGAAGDARVDALARRHLARGRRRPQTRDAAAGSRADRPPAGSSRAAAHRAARDRRALHVRSRTAAGRAPAAVAGRAARVVERLRRPRCSRGLRGPVWFLWGNAHSDQPTLATRWRRCCAPTRRRRRRSRRARRRRQRRHAARGSLAAWQRRLREAAPKTSVLSMLRAAPAAASPPPRPPPPLPPRLRHVAAAAGAALVDVDRKRQEARGGGAGRRPAAALGVLPSSDGAWGSEAGTRCRFQGYSRTVHAPRESRGGAQPGWSRRRLSRR